MSQENFRFLLRLVATATCFRDKTQTTPQNVSRNKWIIFFNKWRCKGIAKMCPKYYFFIHLFTCIPINKCGFAICYKLHQKTPDGEPPAVLWLIIECKFNHFFRKSQNYSPLFLLRVLNTFELITASFVAPDIKVRIRQRPITEMHCRFELSVHHNHQWNRLTIRFWTWGHIITNFFTYKYFG